MLYLMQFGALWSGEPVLRCSSTYALYRLQKDEVPFCLCIQNRGRHITSNSSRIKTPFHVGMKIKQGSFYALNE